MNEELRKALSFRPEKEWIVHHSGLPYLELDIFVPASEIRQEYEKVKHLARYHNPEKYQGWKTLTIFGHGTENHFINDSPREFNPDIAHEILRTIGFLKRYWGCTDNRTKRISFMILEPGAYLLPHTDRRIPSLVSSFNIAIHHPPGAGWRFMDYGDMPISDGKAFAIDISKEHMVWNDSNEDRVHIVAFGPIAEPIIQESYYKKYDKTI